MDQKEIENLRQDYTAAALSEKDVDANPVRQFDKWFNEAINNKVLEPNAMTLATATADGRPSARIVLLKGFSDDGFKFYTNYLSRKGRELSKNPNAALLFFWGDMERQIRIEGVIEKLDKKYSEKYFHSRPKASQIGAIVSPQSQEIESREILDTRMKELEQQYADSEVPKPAHWGGYILKPRLIEFWQGGSGRLHDRIVYKKTDNKNWKIVRLAP
ncbi:MULTISPECIES: pyridoxamine 5'-phosphate oxidase [unclassified Mucilaginibacter]|uniref:pyridoxamine 5'-phosphate oxidase n=1 Tax=unclassified Mucilaginibacter TaxID=2617802 RepID=UPI00096667EB|nr:MULTISPECIES: pyridoxamine 5'-phosphate oxidase [unclassified Mucilaginibacter]OJW18559.1 MAG: pyridoxamine 5'-phosphate oxidase [Mucilaginibacter sp. 44-25]PLW89194.1 MAG: pyridoxamine 5'-phosphate oxidase [Mucilaginibacter sp.]PMP64997.1 MAG: pyridoxamine 5'-phosphate oxidase [Mucilaginibacter sp.]HEK19135.1 pyridoxamine 5'-phosphate oxidase [Bacteroidota bacterium]